MLTPQEIQNQKFERTAFGVRGYDMAQVDQFLDELFNDYSSLYKENAALKTKMRVLVDKIEEYRTVDEEMRKALYNAQVAAKDTVTRAQCEADRILQSARSGASQHVTDLKEETARAEERLKIAKRNNLAYVEKIRRAMEQSIRQLEQVMELSSQPEQAAQMREQAVVPRLFLRKMDVLERLPPTHQHKRSLLCTVRFLLREGGFSAVRHLLPIQHHWSAYRWPQKAEYRPF